LNRTALALTAAAVAVLAGCGGHDRVSGRHVFETSCAGCHAGAHPVGGDLRDMRMSAADVASFARVMPVHPRLTAAEIAAVAAYVAARERTTPSR
jgi:mono/diheme cytochrome c family protein